MIWKLAIIIILSFLALDGIAESTPLTLIGALKGDSWADRIGDACEGLGDINGDGYADFLMTSYGPHDLRLYLGGPHPFDNPPAITWLNHAYLKYSFSPVNIGDIDCDGINDFASMFGSWDSLKVFKGLENLDSSDFIVLSPFPYSGWNDRTRISGGGDNNNDGRNDFWVWSYRGLDNDTIFGYSGCDLLDTIPYLQIRVPSDTVMGYRGISSICSRCDLDGNGIPEIIVGQTSNAAPDYPGRVLIFWGGQNLSMTADLTFHAPQPHLADDDFGGDLDCLGDISGDGIDDLWVSQGGRNYIFYGGQPFDTIPDVSLDWSYMYIDMETVGDVNHDGWNDVVLVDESYLINRVSYIYCGPSMDTLVDVIYSDDDFYHAFAQGLVCCVGIDHSWAGDINGDGLDDILVSARTTDSDSHDYGVFFIQSGWDGDPVDVTSGEDEILPVVSNLSQNRPNPFNSGTVVEFSIPKSGYVELKIYNILGEMVCNLVHQNLIAGEHRIAWDGKDSAGRPTPTGIYFYRLTTDEFSQTRKMVLIK